MILDMAQQEHDKNYSRIVGVIASIIVLLVSVGVFSAWQMRRIHSEVQIIGSWVVSLSGVLDDISASRLEASILLDHALRFADEPLGAGLQGALREDQKRVALLNDLLGAHIAKARTIVSNMSKIESLGIHQDNIAQIDGLLAQIDKIQASYRQRSVSVLNELLDAPSNRNLVGRDELERDSTVLDQSVSQLSRTVNSFVQDAVSLTDSIQRSATLEIALATALAFFAAVLLTIWVRRLHQSLIKSEQLGLLGKMTVTLHHEINNPLAVINGNAYLLRHGAPSEAERIELLDTIQTMGGRIADVVKRVGEIEEVVTAKYVQDVDMLDLFPEKKAVNNR
jgi:signal transduction histidine kinase